MTSLFPSLHDRAFAQLSVCPLWRPHRIAGPTCRSHAKLQALERDLAHLGKSNTSNRTRAATLREHHSVRATPHEQTERVQQPFAHRTAAVRARRVACAAQRRSEQRSRESTVRIHLFSVMRDTMKTFETS